MNSHEAFRAHRRKNNVRRSSENEAQRAKLKRIGIPLSPHQTHWRAAQAFGESLNTIPVGQRIPSDEDYQDACSNLDYDRMLDLDSRDREG